VDAFALGFDFAERVAFARGRQGAPGEVLGFQEVRITLQRLVELQVTIRRWPLRPARLSVCGESR
jgi:hypothetical protein